MQMTARDLIRPRGRIALACVTTLFCVVPASAAIAQVVEIAPFVGYRVGGDPFEAITGVSQDLDGTASAGLACDIPIGGGLSVEVLYSRQEAHLLATSSPGAPSLRVRTIVEYWHAGGLQEFSTGVARPFLTGTLGLTRMAAGADNELRFSIGAGGGVKLRANDHLALRLDGRSLVTFVDGSVSTVICTTGRCFTGLHVTTVWQMDFTAGLALAF
ncbi:MAG TPA: hypothetical protein VH458_18885 [Vicinamibacterales bacterium]|jgi:hypothetical protein